MAGTRPTRLPENDEKIVAQECGPPKSYVAAKDTINVRIVSKRQQSTIDIASLL